MRVLLTGAGGFIGSHLLQKLVLAGISTTALDSPSGGRRREHHTTHGSIRWMQADVGDETRMTGLLAGHDAVVHLAGIFPRFGQPVSMVEMVRANTLATAALLSACRRTGVKRFVLASTAQVYGRTASHHIAESTPLNGATGYAASKIGAEALVRAAAREQGIEALILRLFNVYGPGQSDSNVVATLMRQVLQGNSVSLHSGYPERDFIYVEDVAGALLAALKAEQASGEIINIGTGQGTVIAALASQVLQLAGREGTVAGFRTGEDPTRVGSDRVVADIRRAASLLGWQPSTPLVDGMRRTLEWMRLQMAGQKGEVS